MDRSANMRAIRSKDMKPELAVRVLAHRLGYRRVGRLPEGAALECDSRPRPGD